MGGADRPSHVFRQGAKSGIFILEVLEGGAAAKVGRLRTGDRILKVLVLAALCMWGVLGCVCVRAIIGDLPVGYHSDVAAVHWHVCS